MSGCRVAHTEDIEHGPDGAAIVAFGAPNTENRDVETAPGWWSD